MKKEKLETLVYGLFSILFGMAFFFGVLYPDYGVSPTACRVTDQEIKQPYAYVALDEVEIEDLMNQYGPARVQYKSYFYERLTNSQ